MKNTTFSYFLRRYLNYRSYRVRYSSNKLTTVMVDAYLNPDPSWKVFDAFSPAESLRFYHNLLKIKGVSSGYKNRLLSSYRNMASFAARRGYIASNCLSKIEANLEPLPEERKRKAERGMYTREQIKVFLEATRSEGRLMFELFCYLGARISEFSSLTWDCYDPVSKTIEIRQQVVDQHKGKWVLTKTLKTSESYRACPLSDSLAKELDEYHKSLSVKRNAFIFSLEANHETPFGKTTFRNRMDEAIAKAGLPRITPHGFRHSKATVLLETYGHATKTR